MNSYRDGIGVLRCGVCLQREPCGCAALKGFTTMFQPDTPLYLKDLELGTEDVDQETRKIVKLKFEAQPFTREMADELGVAAELFLVKRQGTRDLPDPTVLAAKLAVHVPLQRMSFKRAPDTEVSLVIDAVEVGPSLKIRRDTERPEFAAIISVSFRYPSGEDLLYIASGYLEQFVMTFETMQADLLENAPKRPRGRPRKANGADEAAGQGAQA
jgi:hypothetical protein